MRQEFEVASFIQTRLMEVGEGSFRQVGAKNRSPRVRRRSVWLLHFGAALLPPLSNCGSLVSRSTQTIEQFDSQLFNLYQGAIALSGGLFVPKPSHCTGCQHCGMPDLGTTVRQRPLASAAGGGDCYSLGYSASGMLRLDRLDANYVRASARVQPMQLSSCADG
jgi:hypothetical protein